MSEELAGYGTDRRETGTAGLDEALDDLAGCLITGAKPRAGTMRRLWLEVAGAPWPGRRSAFRRLAGGGWKSLTKPDRGAE